MARKPRVHFPGAFYHVIVRGNGRQKIFREAEDYQQFLNFLKEYKERYHFILYAYCLMTNHMHLLIEVNDIPLSRIMQNLLFRFTRNFNIKYKRSGHLFQGRYKAILCDKDAYFLELSAYIHLNPVRAKFVKDPGRYKWSSYGTYMKGEKQGLLNTDFLLSQFSRYRSVARKGYEKFVKSHSGDGHREDMYEVSDQRFLGRDEFIEEIQKELNEELSVVYDMSIEDIVATVSSKMGIDTELIYSLTRNRRGALGRAVVGYIGRKFCGYENRAIADHFKREPAALSFGIKNLEKSLEENKVFAKTIEKLERNLARNKNII